MKLKAKKKKAAKVEPQPQQEGEQAQRPAAGKKPKIEKKIYMIVCAALVFLLAGIVALILIISTGKNQEPKAIKRDDTSKGEMIPAEPPPDPAPAEPEEPSDPEPEDEPAPEPSPEPDAEPDPEPAPDPEPEPEPETEPQPEEPPEPEKEPEPEPPEEPDGNLEDDLHISLSDAVNFVEKLSPSLLNLPGESMEQYEILTNQYIIPVDGLLCSEVMVYNRNETTGTNELAATLLVSRGPDSRIFRIDHETERVEELDLGAGQ